MEHYRLYHEDIPQIIADFAAAPDMQRLKHVGMNCGCEYTSFPLFSGLAPYSRFDHSMGVALIIWHFTHDAAQTVAGLLHDIATPVFAHVVDFLRGDHVKQEATEAGTEKMIASSAAIQQCLRRHGLTTDDVCDYHRYPIADNDTPQLSADRLEYTIGNVINYGICTAEEAAAFYRDLTVTENESGAPELGFRTADTASRFARAALACSRIYVADEDRYAMQMLAECLRDAINGSVIRTEDLHTTEPEVSAKLLSDDGCRTRWEAFRRLHAMQRADAPDSHPGWRQIPAKKRFIDPYAVGAGRVSAFDDAFRHELDAFLRDDLTVWVCQAD